MRTLRIIIALLASFSLVVFGEIIPELSANVTMSTKLTYSALLLINFVYLHYIFHNYLSPISKLTLQQKQEILSATSSYYYTSFFHGAIGLGYFVLLMLLIPMFSGVTFDSGGYLLTSVLLVIFGAVSKARGLILYLLNEHQNQKTHNN